MAELYKDKEWLEEQYRTKSARIIAKEFGFSRGKIEYWIKKHELGRRFRHIVDESKFDVQDPIFCYFAGLVATDGHLDKKVPRVTVSLKESSSDVLQRLADYFSYEGRVYEHNGRYTLCISSERLIEALREMGVERFSNKTKEVCVPSTFASDDCMKMYVRGCIDGDGNIKKQAKPVVRLFCGSELFVDGLISIIQSKGIQVEKTYHRTKGIPYPGFEMRQEPSKQLLDWVYSGYEGFWLTRKYERYAG